MVARDLRVSFPLGRCTSRSLPGGRGFALLRREDLLRGAQALLVPAGQDLVHIVEVDLVDGLDHGLVCIVDEFTGLAEGEPPLADVREAVVRGFRRVLGEEARKLGPGPVGVGDLLEFLVRGFQRRDAFLRPVLTDLAHVPDALALFDRVVDDGQDDFRRQAVGVVHHDELRLGVVPDGLAHEGLHFLEHGL